ncbi:hypothetical protein BDK51DRAFT_6004, partial [Blyttiomyces helicus]
LPPIRVTLGSAEDTIMFRVSDQGGRIPRATLDSTWSHSHPSKSRFLNFSLMPRLAAKVDGSKIVPPTLHLGLGLPMSRIYAGYWGGELRLQSMVG